MEIGSACVGDAGHKAVNICSSSCYLYMFIVNTMYIIYLNMHVPLCIIALQIFVIVIFLKRKLCRGGGFAVWTLVSATGPLSRERFTDMLNCRLYMRNMMFKV